MDVSGERAWTFKYDVGDLYAAILSNKSVSGELNFEIFDSVPAEIPVVMDLRPERRMMLMLFLYLLIHVCWDKQQDNNPSSTSSMETATNLYCAREFTNIKLIWPISTTHKVLSRVWYKNDTLVSRIYENDFKEGPGYKGRLKYVGDGNIEIRNVTRIDSGNYKRTSMFRGVSNKSEVSVNLQVIDAPARTCKPVISHEGSNLKAYLPSDDVCTTSQLRLEWIDTKTVIIQNGTTILDLGTDSGVRVYMVCAVGEARKCFQGNMSDFCTNYTVSQHKQSADGVTIPLAVGILIAFAIGVIVICLQQKGYICQKSRPSVDDTDRFMHIAYLLVNVGSKVLRRLLLFHTVTPTCTLDQYLAKERTDIDKLRMQNKLNKSQMAILYPPVGSTNLGDYDITLLYVLFTNIVHTISQQQLNMIQSLRDKRNEIAHKKSVTVNLNDYQIFWNDICTKLEALCKQCNDPDFENEITREIQGIQVSTVQGTSLLPPRRMETLERLVQDLISSRAQE